MQRSASVKTIILESYEFAVQFAQWTLQFFEPAVREGFQTRPEMKARIIRSLQEKPFAHDPRDLYKHR